MVYVRYCYAARYWCCAPAGLLVEVGVLTSTLTVHAQVQPPWYSTPVVYYTMAGGGTQHGVGHGYSQPWIW